MKTKLFHIISRLDIGGAERQLLTLVSLLDKEKYDICVGYFEGAGELEKEFQKNKIKTKKFRFAGLWYISIWWQLYQDMKVNRYDIVHTHGFKADLWGAIAGKLTGVKVIISTMHNQEQYLKNPLIKFLERRIIYAINDAVIVISNAVKKFLIKTCGVPEQKIKTVYYGINPLDIKTDKNKEIRQELGIDRNAALIGCIGRLVKQKGHIHLIQAAKEVVKKFPQAKFLIVGKGNLEKRLKNQVERAGLSSQIIFTGFKEDVYAIMDALDLMVMPSLWEGFGLVLLEAMALGKPIVATKTGGIPEIIEDGRTGILVEAKNSDALGRGIINLLQDTPLAKSIKDSAKLRVNEKFSVDKMVKEIDNIYSRLLTQKQKKKINVLQIIESTGKSGPRYLLNNLVYNLNKDRFETDVICSTQRDKDFLQDIRKMRESGIKVIILQMKRGISPLSDLIAFFKLAFYIKKGKYDIVHTHSSKAGFLGRLCARLMGVKIIIHTPHCFCFEAQNMHKLHKRFYFYIEKFAALFCDKIIAVSESQRNDTIKRGLVKAQKIITIENGIDIHKFGNNGFDISKAKQALGLSSAPVILGSVGVLNESKGHRYLIEAVAQLINEGLNVSLIIAGEGILRKELETLSDKLGLDGRIKLLGFREDIHQIFSLMDIFVFPSLWEGMSLALLEAMACGLPVISTEVHGAVDLLGNNQRGILVKRRDVLGLTKAIKYLIFSPDEAKKMAQAAKELIRHNYTIEKQNAQIESLYTGMIFSFDK